MMSVLVSLIVILMRATPSLRVVKRAIMPCLAKTSLASSFIASSLEWPTALMELPFTRLWRVELPARAPNGQARAPNGQETSTRSGVSKLDFHGGRGAAGISTRSLCLAAELPSELVPGSRVAFERLA